MASPGSPGACSGAGMMAAGKLSAALVNTYPCSRQPGGSKLQTFTMPTVMLQQAVPDMWQQSCAMLAVPSAFVGVYLQL